MNCVTYALGRVHRVGGYLLIRLSEHWGVPHMMHIDKQGLSHYVPHQRLVAPITALIGFDGRVERGDPSKAPPMPLSSLLIGVWILAFTVTFWCARQFVLNRGKHETVSHCG